MVTTFTVLPAPTSSVAQMTPLLAWESAPHEVPYALAEQEVTGNLETRQRPEFIWRVVPNRGTEGGMGMGSITL